MPGIPTGMGALTPTELSALLQQHGGMVRADPVTTSVPDPDFPNSKSLAKTSTSFRYTMQDGSQVTVSFNPDTSQGPDGVWNVDPKGTALKGDQTPPKVVQAKDGTIYSVTTDAQGQQDITTLKEARTMPWSDANGQQWLLTPTEYNAAVRNANDQGNLAVKQGQLGVQQGQLQNSQDKLALDQQAAQQRSDVQKYTQYLDGLKLSDDEKYKALDTYIAAQKDARTTEVDQANQNNQYATQNLDALALAQKAGQDAQDNALKLQATRVGPNFGADFSNALNAGLGSAPQGSASFSPSDFVSPAPNLGAIGEQAVNGILAQMAGKITKNTLTPYDPTKVLNGANAYAATNATAVAPPIETPVSPRPGPYVPPPPAPTPNLLK